MSADEAQQQAVAAAAAAATPAPARITAATKERPSPQENLAVFRQLANQAVSELVKHAPNAGPQWANRARASMPTSFAEIALRVPQHEATAYASHMATNRIGIDGARCSMASEGDRRELLQIIIAVASARIQSPIYSIQFVRNGAQFVQCILDFGTHYTAAREMFVGLQRYLPECLALLPPSAFMAGGDPQTTLFLKDYGIDAAVCELVAEKRAELLAACDGSFDPATLDDFAVAQIVPLAGVLASATTVDSAAAARLAGVEGAAAADGAAEQQQQPFSPSPTAGLAPRDILPLVNGPTVISARLWEAQGTAEGQQTAAVFEALAAQTHVAPHPINDGEFFATVASAELVWQWFFTYPALTQRLQSQLFLRFGIFMCIALCETEFKTASAVAAQPTAVEATTSAAVTGEAEASAAAGENTTAAAAEASAASEAAANVSGDAAADSAPVGGDDVDDDDDPFGDYAREDAVSEAQPLLYTTHRPVHTAAAGGVPTAAATTSFGSALFSAPPAVSSTLAGGGFVTSAIGGLSVPAGLSALPDASKPTAADAAAAEQQQAADMASFLPTVEDDDEYYPPVIAQAPRPAAPAANPYARHGMEVGLLTADAAPITGLQALSMATRSGHGAGGFAKITRPAKEKEDKDEEKEPSSSGGIAPQQQQQQHAAAAHATHSGDPSSFVRSDSPVDDDDDDLPNNATANFNAPDGHQQQTAVAVNLCGAGVIPNVPLGARPASAALSSAAAAAAVNSKNITDLVTSAPSAGGGFRIFIPTKRPRDEDTGGKKEQPQKSAAPKDTTAKGGNGLTVDALLEQPLAAVIGFNKQQKGGTTAADRSSGGPTSPRSPPDTEEAVGGHGNGILSAAGPPVLPTPTAGGANGAGIMPTPSIFGAPSILSTPPILGFAPSAPAAATPVPQTDCPARRQEARALARLAAEFVLTKDIGTNAKTNQPINYYCNFAATERDALKMLSAAPKLRWWMDVAAGPAAYRPSRAGSISDIHRVQSCLAAVLGVPQSALNTNNNNHHGNNNNNSKGGKKQQQSGNNSNNNNNGEGGGGGANINTAPLLALMKEAGERRLVADVPQWWRLTEDAGANNATTRAAAAGTTVFDSAPYPASGSPCPPIAPDAWQTAMADPKVSEHQSASNGLYYFRFTPAGAAKERSSYKHPITRREYVVTPQAFLLEAIAKAQHDDRLKDLPVGCFLPRVAATLRANNGRPIADVAKVLLERHHADLLRLLVCALRYFYVKQWYERTPSPRPNEHPRYAAKSFDWAVEHVEHAAASAPSRLVAPMPCLLDAVMWLCDQNYRVEALDELVEALLSVKYPNTLHA